MKKYIDIIIDTGREAPTIVGFPTVGDIRPPHLYQYQAKCPPLEGEDDYSEGIGWSPEEAVKNLCENIKKAN